MMILDSRFTWILFIVSMLFVLRPKRKLWLPFWVAIFASSVWPISQGFNFLSSKHLGLIENGLMGILFGSILSMVIGHRVISSASEEIQKVRKRVLYKLPLLCALVSYTLGNNLGIGFVFIFCGLIAVISAFMLIRRHNIFWYHLAFIILITLSFAFHYASFSSKHMIVNAFWILGFLTMMNVVKSMELENDR